MVATNILAANGSRSPRDSYYTMPLLRELFWRQHQLLECIWNRLGSTKFQTRLFYLLQRVYEGEYGDTEILR